MEFKVPELPKSEYNKGDKATIRFTPSAPPEPQKNKIPYKIPKWSAAPASNVCYKFEVLKSGQIIDEVNDLQQQPFWSFGRLHDNDIEMAHPTISRFHAVLQYKPKPGTIPDNYDNDNDNDEEAANKNSQPEGWYVFDLNSTHGTFLNKLRIPPHVYMRMRVGHMLKLGASTRSYILQGPAEDEEPESELSVTELRAQREQREADAIIAAELKAREKEERERNEFVCWGMGEDADEETDLTHNPFASSNNEDLFLDDPKKTLRGYFEREGLQLEYKCDEIANGSFVCRVELPLDDSNGRPIVAEVVHKGRKKDCVVQCALEACRILDRHGVLRQANQEPQKRKQQTKANDSDDEDEFWDRTGDIERKKQRLANTGVSVTLTYDDLLKQEYELTTQIQQVESDIAVYQAKQQRIKDVAIQQQSASDDLDNFMNTLNEDVSQVDRIEIKKLRLEQQRLTAEIQKVQRLTIMAKPTDLPFTTIIGDIDASKMGIVGNINKKQLPMIGKRNQFSKMRVVKATSPPVNTKKLDAKAFASDEEEMEDDIFMEERDDKKKTENNKDDANIKTIESDKESEVEMSDVNEIDTLDKTNLKNVDGGEKPQAASPLPPPPSTSSSSSSALIQEQNAPVAHVSNPSNIEGDKEEEEVDEEQVPDAVEQADGDKGTLAASAQSNEDANSKRRHRVRQRGNKQRHDVDIDELEEHEVSEKYAKWLPPANQTGDGMTALNEKFGY